MKKKMVSMRLPEWLLEWMQKQPAPQSALVESAMIKEYDLMDVKKEAFTNADKDSK